MKITRCELPESEEMGSCDWPALVDVSIATRLDGRVYVEWLGYREGYGPGFVAVAVDGVPAEAAPNYRYGLMVHAKELGTMLVGMPLEAVPAVVDHWLQGSDPELIGAVVGRIITLLAARTAGVTSERASQAE